MSKSLSRKLSFDSPDLGFLAHGKAASLEESPIWANSILYVAFVMLACGLIWAHFSEINEVSRAMGQVIPSSKVQIIQSLEGGFLRALYAKEGQRGKRGRNWPALMTRGFHLR